MPLALALLLLLLLQGLIFIGESSQTSDEAAHLAAGYSYLLTGDFRLNREHPPLIKELAAAPLLAVHLDFPWGPLWEQAEEWNLGRMFVHENRLSNDTILLLARLPMLALSLLLGWSIFHWGRRLFGARGALLATALYVLDPNVVAHSCLVTTDLGVTLFIFLAVYALWCWSRRPSPRTLILLGLAVGGAFASKFTALWLLPILAALAVVLIATGTPLPLRPWSARSALTRTEERSDSPNLALALAGAIVAGIALLVVVVCYAGRGVPTFLVGLEIGLQHSGRGHSAYLLGEISDTGWWYYFLFAYLVKTPIGILVVVALALALLAFGRRLPLRDEMFLGIPVLITIAITCLWKVNIGLRHLLPIYPFLYLAAGRIVAPLPAGGPERRPARYLPAILLECHGRSLIEAARNAPFELADINHLAGGPENGHRILLDSNLDWGQGAKALRRYVTAEGLPAIYCAFAGNSDPWYYGVSYEYVPGSGNLEISKRRGVRVPERVRRELLAISPMVLHSVHFSDQHLYDWLLERTPVAMPGYASLVFDITGDAAAHAILARLALNFDLLDLADFEAHRALRLDPKSDLAKAVLDKVREETAAGTPETGPN